MIVTTAQLFKVAYGQFAIGAYNVNNAEQAMGLFKGCQAGPPEGRATELWLQAKA
jgi:fructose/tagatose bisphosphate aldolase